MARRFASAWYCTLTLFLLTAGPALAGHTGYYRFPALHGDTVVFTAEGDLWTVGVEGGIARRLTSHAGEESHAAISPDGRTVAFSAAYEGPTEVYTMPLEGGLPVRRTWHGRRAVVAGWTPDGEILCATSRNCGLPCVRLLRIDPRNGGEVEVPLDQASQGAFEIAATRTVFFTRFPFQGSYTKRYRGGTAQSLWRFTEGDSEATPLTGDHPGTSRDPMWWDGRVYFTADRDGTMNLWSMSRDGGDLRQHTRHDTWDVTSPSLFGGRVVYQSGADLRLHEIATGRDEQIPITLASDLDQMRETWIADPMEYLTAAHPSPDGRRVVLTARGQVFVAPAGHGRLVEATRRPGVRYRSARFLPDGRSLVALSDQSGEVEFWRLPANGAGSAEQITRGGSVLRFDGIPSPDGQWIACEDKNHELWIFEVDGGGARRVAASLEGPFGEIRWSPDSRWLAFVQSARSQFSQILLFSVDEGAILELTSDRFDSWSPAFSADGRWIWFLSQRELRTLPGGVWGTRQPEPYFDASTGIYGVPLVPGARSPFAPPDELHVVAESGEDEAGRSDNAKRGDGAGRGDNAERGDGAGRGDNAERGDGAGRGAKARTDGAPRVRIEPSGLRERIEPVPIPPGNYEALSAGEKRLFFVSRDGGIEPARALCALSMEWDAKPERLAEEIRSYELSADRRKILLRVEDALHVLDASVEPGADLAEARVDLSGWTFAIDPREERRQMFTEAWRLERDYFYDPSMHGVDWPAVLEKYLPLVDRVTDRAELSDLLGQMIGELSALHMWVWGGAFREGKEQIQLGALGARLERDEPAGGYRVAHVHKTDPDRPERLSPCRRPGVDIREGDVIVSINGVRLLDLNDPGATLRNQAGRQVLLRVRSDRGERDVIATPLSPQEERELRYDEWEYTRRLRVEEAGAGEIGYVHLRSMTTSDFADWSREFHPVFHRAGLILDLRANTGGNIDSWILARLLRKAWMWWQPRVGHPYSNMQYAFTGHAVVLCDSATMSDGEALAEGFRRLGLGAVIGTRTWGGEIWLTSSNTLVDNGIATAAEFGVYGPEGQWLIEGHGVDPDIVVDNLPHATFRGHDAQLEAAIEHLRRKIESEPVGVPAAPRYPDKSWRPVTR